MVRAKGKVLSVVIFCFIAVTVIRLPAQSTIPNQRLDIKYSKAGKNENLYPLFSILASNNSVNIYSLGVNVTFSVKYDLKEQGNYYKFNYRFYDKKASGNVKFRDFVIDTLLIPDSVEAVIKLKYGANYETYRQKISFHNGALLLQKNSYTAPKPYAYLTVTNPCFSLENLNRFLTAAGQINNYYGYSLLYSKVLKYFGKLNLKSHNTPSEVFTALLALNRLESYANKHDFENYLHLENGDVENLIKKRTRAGRMLTREKTLMKQKLGTPPPADDCFDFVKEYVGLSGRAIAEAKKLQPFRAGSFKEFASEFQSPNTLKILKTIEKYYNSSAGCDNVMQLIFNRFVKEATLSAERKSYVYGLILLENAAYLYKNFKSVKRSAGFINTYAKLYDGLLSSYASVAVSALKAGNKKMFDEYYSKAGKLFEKYLADTTFSNLKIIFPEYRNLLEELALLNGNSVEYINNALLANAGIKDSVLNALYLRYYSRKFDEGIKRIDMFLESGRLFAAKNSVEQTERFLENHSDLGWLFLKPDSTLNAEAYHVYLELLQEGEIAYDKGNISRAMDYLSAAYDMERRFFDFRSENLQNMLEKCFTPMAMQKLENASLQIWANRTDKAEEIIAEVKALSEKYKQQDNVTVNNEIEKLQKRINLRICQSFQQEVDNLCYKIEALVNRGEIDKAQTNYEKLMIMQNAESRCRLNRSNIRKTVACYSALFDFNRDFKALKQKIFKQGFSKSIAGYVNLEEQYESMNISHFNTGFLSLYDFVKSQNSRTITSRALEFLLNNNDYKEAFRYLELLQKMNIDPAVTRTYQRKLAKLYRQNNEKPDEIVFTNRWYSTFKNYYSGLVKEKLNNIKLTN